MKPLDIIAEGLRDIVLPPVIRPAIGPNDEPTEELVCWGITFHVYSEIAHIRTMLAGLKALAEIGNTPSGNILSRHIFEWTAHACYMEQNLKGFIANRQWKLAFDLLLQVDTGNAWARDHGHKYDPTPFPEEILKPIRIKKLMAAYTKYQTEQYGHTKAEDSYGFLSEYAHPNAACFLQYRDFDGAHAYLVAPPTKSTFGGINGFIIEWLMFMQALLGLAKELEVRDRLIAMLPALAELAK
jgi:hypothetical protein